MLCAQGLVVRVQACRFGFCTAVGGCGVGSSGESEFETLGFGVVSHQQLCYMLDMALVAPQGLVSHSCTAPKEC